MEHPGNDDGVALDTARRGYTEVVPQPDKSSPSQVGKYLGLGLLLPVSTVVGYALGSLLDRLFGTTFLRIALLIVGTAAGFVQLYRGLSQDTGDGGS